MNKISIKPGNGLNLPLKGEYVKINLLIYDKKGKSIFNSANSDGVTIRYLEGRLHYIIYTLNKIITNNLHFI